MLAGLCWLGQASIHPQMPILMGGATAVALLLRPASPRGWLAAVVAFAIPAPYILYCYFAFIGNPQVQRWTFHSKNALPPEAFSLFFAIAPQLLLALTGLPVVLRRRSREDLFLIAWLVLLAAILYLPNPAGDLRRRFLDGLYLPLVVLGAIGLYETILPRLRSARAHALIPFSYVAFTAIGSAFLVLAPMLIATQPQYSVPRTWFDGLTLAGRPAVGAGAVDAGGRAVRARLQSRHRVRRPLRRDLRLREQDADGARAADRQAGHRRSSTPPTTSGT